MASRTDHMIKERYQRLCRTFGTSDIDKLKALAESRKQKRCSPGQTTQQRRLAIIKEVDEATKDKDLNMTPAQKCDWLYEHLLSHNLADINSDEMPSEARKPRKSRKRARAKSPEQALDIRRRSTEAAERAIQAVSWDKHELNDEQEIESDDGDYEQEEVDEEMVWDEEEMDVEEEEVEEAEEIDGEEEEVGDEEETDEEEEEDVEDEDADMEENKGREKKLEEHDQWKCAIIEAMNGKGEKAYILVWGSPPK
ncbi:hypothetical protein MTO96_022937 [Rhipicephalus appendiculatus]